MIGQKGFPMAGGGVETHVDNLSRNLAEQGQEVLIYSRNNYGNGVQSVFSKRISRIVLPTIPQKHLATALHSLLASIDVLFRPVDIVHYHGIGPSLFIWVPKLFKPSARIVSTIHSRDYFHGKWGALSRLALKLGERFAALAADQLIGVSKENTRHMRAAYGKHTKYIPNGVRIPAQPKTSGAGHLKRLGLEPGKYILSVSRLVPHKGVHTLIEAFNELPGDISLAVVGDSSHTSDYVAQLKKLANNSSRIIFTGKQTGKDLETLFRNAMLFVQPSSAEGLSISLLEAMSYQIPSITSDIKANTDVVGAGKHVFTTHSTRSLHKVLSHFTKSRPVQKALAEKQFALVQQYLWDRVSEQTLAVYTDLHRKPESRSTTKRSISRVFNNSL